MNPISYGGAPQGIVSSSQYEPCALMNSSNALAGLTAALAPRAGRSGVDGSLHAATAKATPTKAIRATVAEGMGRGITVFSGEGYTGESENRAGR
ncbi:MAG: hypothetical protein IPK85_09195 [Gemmatimonadetes bacterium]|nr:hypothetical protein [Gemmatimonadota bacterium]